MSIDLQILTLKAIQRLEDKIDALESEVSHEIIEPKESAIYRFENSEIQLDFENKELVEEFITWLVERDVQVEVCNTNILFYRVEDNDQCEPNTNT
jgi:ABC-type thiamine transport system substrate-binding protein